MMTERDCINLIRQHVRGRDNEYLVKGIGDDCAVLKKDEDSCLLLTTDTLVQGVHFDLSWHPPYLLGRKSAAVNLSDIAAMGGRPRACLLSVGFPGAVPAWLDEFIAGFTAMLQEHDTLLVGGDTVKGRHDLIISVTVLGEAETGHICYRSGALPGDLVFVSGFLGEAAAGLALCRSGFAADGPGQWRQLFDAHLDPQPRVQLGKILAASGLVHAMMDISDGLATDLAHICTASNTGAEISRDALPVSEQLRTAAVRLAEPVLEWVLKGGEDYQLLFTAAADQEQALRRLLHDKNMPEIFRIGKIIRGQGVFLADNIDRKDISYQGHDHFVA